MQSIRKMPRKIMLRLSLAVATFALLTLPGFSGNGGMRDAEPTDNVAPPADIFSLVREDRRGSRAFVVPNGAADSGDAFVSQMMELPIQDFGAGGLKERLDRGAAGSNPVHRREPKQERWRRRLDGTFANQSTERDSAQ